MCGRFVVTVPDLSELAAAFGVVENRSGEWTPHFNIAPTQLAPRNDRAADRHAEEFLERLALANEYPTQQRLPELVSVAYVGHRGHAYRWIVITEVGDQSRSEAT